MKVQPSDVVYGTSGESGRDLSLRLYAGEPGARWPGMVFVHGGGWRYGDLSMMVPLAEAVAAEGYVAASIGYRLLGEAPWPAALVDARCAVRWMRTHAEAIGLDADRLAIAGGSAGAHVAALVALTPGGVESGRGIQAAVLYNPVLDLRDTRFAAAVLGDRADDEKAVAEASPITHLTRSSPPVLTIVGDQDDITPPSTCAPFHWELDRLGIPNHLEVVPGADHGLPIADVPTCTKTTTQFLAQHL